MGYFDVTIVLLHVLESLQLQSQNHRQLLHPHPLLSFLITAAVIAFKLVITAERLCVAEASQAMRYRGVLINIDLQVEEVFIFAADRLAIEASSFAGENALEDFVHPCWLCACGTAGTDIADRHTLRSSLVPLGKNDFIDVIDEKVEELVRILLHVVIELFLLLTQSSDELLRCNRAHLLLLRRNRIKPKRNHIIDFVWMC